MAKRDNSNISVVSVPKRFKSFAVPKPIETVEDDLIALQEKFLTPGFQYLKVPTIKTGRVLIETILSSLNCYGRSSVVSLDASAWVQGADNLFVRLKEGGFLDPMSVFDLEDFLLDYFEGDFLWIEATQQLLAQPWFSYFEQKIVDLNIAQHIPVLIISYDQE